MVLRERTFTVDEYHRMAQAGILGEDERVELIEGRIVKMNPIGPAHLWSVNRLTRMFARQDGVLVSVGNPIRLDQGSEPGPDLAVVRADAAQDHTPGPADVLLVIEVADSSLGYDRQVKASLYARAGIPELWIADLGGERVEAHRDPSAAGYRTVHLILRGERISPYSRRSCRSKSTRSSASRCRKNSAGPGSTGGQVPDWTGLASPRRLATCASQRICVPRPRHAIPIGPISVLT